jgi:alkylation response protein AidB-like acyl-CoA dehydrogenase
MASTVYAMESVSDLAQWLADEKGYDIRLEAAAAKEWNTVKAWRIVDETMQIRGGRGYEKASSLAARARHPWTSSGRCATCASTSSSRAPRR